MLWLHLHLISRSKAAYIFHHDVILALLGPPLHYVSPHHSDHRAHTPLLPLSFQGQAFSAPLLIVLWSLIFPLKALLHCVILFPKGRNVSIRLLAAGKMASETRVPLPMLSPSVRISPLPIDFLHFLLRICPHWCPSLWCCTPEIWRTCRCLIMQLTYGQTP